MDGGADTVEVDLVLTPQVCPTVSHLTEQVQRRVELYMVSGRLRLRSLLSLGTGTTLYGSRRRGFRYGRNIHNAAALKLRRMRSRQISQVIFLLGG